MLREEEEEKEEEELGKKINIDPADANDEKLAINIQLEEKTRN